MLLLRVRLLMGITKTWHLRLQKTDCQEIAYSDRRISGLYRPNRNFVGYKRSKGV